MYLLANDLSKITTMFQTDMQKQTKQTNKGAPAVGSPGRTRACSSRMRVPRVEHKQNDDLSLDSLEGLQCEQEAIPKK